MAETQPKKCQNWETCGTLTLEAPESLESGLCISCRIGKHPRPSSVQQEPPRCPTCGGLIGSDGRHSCTTYQFDHGMGKHTNKGWSSHHQFDAEFAVPEPLQLGDEGTSHQLLNQEPKNNKKWGVHGYLYEPNQEEVHDLLGEFLSTLRVHHKDLPCFNDAVAVAHIKRLTAVIPPQEEPSQADEKGLRQAWDELEVKIRIDELDKLEMRIVSVGSGKALRSRREELEGRNG